MAQMNVSLPDQLKGWAEQRVAEGRYSSTSDYVRDLVRRDEERAKVDRLKHLIQQGLESPLGPMAEDVYERMQQRIDARHTTASKTTGQ